VRTRSWAGEIAGARRRSTTTSLPPTACSIDCLAAQPFTARSARRCRQGIDRERCGDGRVLHAIASWRLHSDPPNIELTDAGRPAGKIPLFYFRNPPRRERHRRLPAGRAQAGRAIILSHAGTLGARQPGVAVHARGDAGARSTNPSAAPGQLRPPERIGLRGRGGRTSTVGESVRQLLLRRETITATGAGRPARALSPEISAEPPRRVTRKPSGKSPPTSA